MPWDSAEKKMQPAGNWRKCAEFRSWYSHCVHESLPSHFSTSSFQVTCVYQYAVTHRLVSKRTHWGGGGGYFVLKSMVVSPLASSTLNWLYIGGTGHVTLRCWHRPREWNLPPFRSFTSGRYLWILFPVAFVREKNGVWNCHGDENGDRVLANFDAAQIHRYVATFRRNKVSPSSGLKMFLLRNLRSVNSQKNTGKTSCWDLNLFI
jgi:hypothetical protein